MLILVEVDISVVGFLVLFGLIEIVELGITIGLGDEIIIALCGVVKFDTPGLHATKIISQQTISRELIIFRTLPSLAGISR